MTPPTQTCTLRTGAGDLRGALRENVRIFRGIPYAVPDTAGKRFSEAAPTPSWSGLRDATALPAIFPQLPSRLAQVNGRGVEDNPQSEEAFLLNVWAPADASQAPVLVFLHGGAFVSGGGTAQWYDGERLARETGIVVVSVNYRLGALGHLCLPQAGLDGNLPVRDLLVALQWVQRHIEAFGGNPQRVTVAGQSAGAWYAYLLGASPASKGLLRQTLLLSVPDRPPMEPETARRLGREFLDLAGARDIATLTTSEVLNIQSSIMRRSSGFAEIGLAFYPVQQDGLVPEWLADYERAAAESHIEASMIGYTSEENAAFLFRSEEVLRADARRVRQWYEEKFGDRAADFYEAFAAARPAHTPYTQTLDAASFIHFKQPAMQIAHHLSAQGKPSYLYEFAYQTQVPDLYSPHCFDLPFLFGNRDAWHDAPMLAQTDMQHFEAVGGELRSAVGRYVKTGNPGPAADGAWQPYSSQAPGLTRLTDRACGAELPMPAMAKP